jgi:hypothetical protein
MEVASASDDNIRLQKVLSGTDVLSNEAQKFKTYKSEENNNCSSAWNLPHCPKVSQPSEVNF